MKEKDIKILWGRSASRCAICRKELTSESSESEPYTLGQQAHIVGEKKSAARGISDLLPEERNSYHNIILLCDNHHSEIDKNPGDWSVEKLHMIKTRHEQYVSENFASSESMRENANLAAIATAIDAVDLCCSISEVGMWGSDLVTVIPRMSVERFEGLKGMQYVYVAAIWPENLKGSRLHKAFENVASATAELHQVFARHIEKQDGMLIADRFYKNIFPNPQYEEDHMEYEAWIHELHLAVVEAIKALNLFCDVVREDVNPLFYLEQGRAVLRIEDSLDNKLHLCAPQYSKDEAATVIGHKTVA